MKCMTCDANRNYIMLMVCIHACAHIFVANSAQHRSFILMKIKCNLRCCNTQSVLPHDIRPPMIHCMQNKSDWEPNERQVECLGFTVNSHRMSISVPRKKARAVSRQIKQSMRRDGQGRLRLRQFATTLGQIIALSPAIPHARLHARHLYARQASAVNSEGWHRNPSIHLSQIDLAELKWWLTCLGTMRRCPLRHRYLTHELTLVASDASDLSIAAAPISHPRIPVWSRSLSRRERREPIRVRELRAAYEGKDAFPEVSGTHLNFRIDNLNVVSAINRWSSKDHLMTPLLTQCATLQSQRVAHDDANLPADDLTHFC